MPHLVHVESFDDGVEARVKVIEHLHDLQRRAQRRQHREADDVTEEDRDAVVRLRLHSLANFELIGNRTTRTNVTYSIAPHFPATSIFSASKPSSSFDLFTSYHHPRNVITLLSELFRRIGSFIRTIIMT